MKVLCNLATKKIEGFSRWDDIAFNSDTHIVLVVADMPDMELDKLSDTNDSIVKPTQEELASIAAQEYIDSIAADVQRELDKEAQTKGYDSIHTAVTYADEPTNATFQADGQSFRAWRSNVWAYCYAALGQYENDLAAYPALLEAYEAEKAQYDIDVIDTPELIEPVAPSEVATPTIEDIVAGMPVRP